MLSLVAKSNLWNTPKKVGFASVRLQQSVEQARFFPKTTSLSFEIAILCSFSDQMQLKTAEYPYDWVD